MTARPSSDLDYTLDRARADFENGIYPAVIAIRLGTTESNIWNLAEAEGWRRPAGEKVAA